LSKIAFLTFLYYRVGETVRCDVRCNSKDLYNTDLMKKLSYYLWYHKKISKVEKRFHAITMRIPIPDNFRTMSGMGSFDEFYWNFENKLIKSSSSGVRLNHYLRRKWKSPARNITKEVRLVNIIKVWELVTDKMIQKAFIKTFGIGFVQYNPDLKRLMSESLCHASSHTMVWKDDDMMLMWSHYLWSMKLVEYQPGVLIQIGFD